MSWIDLISGGFQIAAGFAVAGHIYQARKAGRVIGVSIASLVFFASWSAWNLFMFSYLGMPFAAGCAFAALVADLAWLYTARKLK